MKIGQFEIGENKPCFIIAEIGINHDGNIDKAKELISIASNTGASAVKFQSFIPEDLYSAEACPEGIELLNRYKLSFEDQQYLFDYAKLLGILFLSTPFEFKSAKMLADLGVEAFKIGSGEINYFEFLEYIAKFDKPVILSTGGSSISDVDKALGTIKNVTSADVAILHCVSSYPAKPEDLHLRAINTLRHTFPDSIIGYSDHSEGFEAAIAAVTLGARIIEKHLTYDKNADGPDHKASASPEEFHQMVKSIRQVEKMLGSSEKKRQLSEIKFTRSLTIKREIKKGEEIKEEDIVACRPSGGLAPVLKYIFSGRKASRDIKKDELASFDMI
jgi:sialic acid synthase SpsE